MILMNNFLYSYQNKIGDNMKKEILWELFQNTGKIEYYLKYKEEKRKEG